MPSRLETWWSRPDHYAWLESYLATRGLSRPAAMLVGGAVAFLGGIEALMMLTPAGPSAGPPQRIAAIAVIVGCGVTATFWFRLKWPSRTQSTVFVMVSALLMAVSCLIESDPMSSIAACGLFGILAGYAAIFHSVRVIAFVIAVAVPVAAVLAVRIAEEADPVLAVSKLLAVLGGSRSSR